MELVAMIVIGLVWLVASAYMDHSQRKNRNAVISRISLLTQQTATANDEMRSFFSPPRSNAKTGAEPAVFRHGHADTTRR